MRCLTESILRRFEEMKHIIAHAIVEALEVIDEKIDRHFDVYLGALC